MNDELQGITGARYKAIDTSPQGQALWVAMQQIAMGMSTLTSVISSLQQEVEQLKKEKQ